MKQRSFLQRWLDNSYLLFIFSVVISLVIWMYMSFTTNTNTNTTTFAISDVPVQIELSETAHKEGMQAFTEKDPKATVTVSGNRTVLGLVNENDLSVTASAGSINSPGTYNLPVSAAKRSNRGNFQIISYTPETIENVTVDYFKEKEFPIQEGLTFHVAENYYAAVSLPYSTVTISGPQTEISKINKVFAKADLTNEDLTTNREVEATIELYDEAGNKLSKKLLSMSIESMKVTVTVLPQKHVPVEPVFIEKPEGLEITDDMLTITPSELIIAAPEDTLANLKSVKLDPIDFTKLKNDVITYDELGFTIPENCKKVSNYNSVALTIDLRSFVSKTFTVEQFKVVGLSSDYDLKVSSNSIEVTVIGPKDDLDKLTAKDITAIIDTSDSSGKTGSVEMPVTFAFGGVTKCWAYGTYQANVTVTKK